MKTIPLYYQQPALFDFESKLVAVLPAGHGQAWLELEASAFYPEGGGQPADRGTIHDRAVLDVQTEQGCIRHLVEASDGSPETAWPAAGTMVRCRVDSARRLDHASQHSAQHVLSALALKLLNAPTRSFHLGATYSSIDIDVPLPDEDRLRELELAVQRAIDNPARLQTLVCDRKAAEALDLRRLPPDGEEELRIVEISGLDRTPCCGTHVSSTAELRLFRLLRAEKYKGMTRLYFLAGDRAVGNYRQLSESARNTASLLGCSETDIESFARERCERQAMLERELAQAYESLAKSSARLLAAGELAGLEPAGFGLKPLGRQGSVVAAGLDSGSLEYGRLLVKELAALNLVGIVLLRPLHTVLAAAPDPVWALNRRLGALLPPKQSGQGTPDATKQACRFPGAKGGGGAVAFQAALPDADLAGAFVEAATQALQESGPTESGEKP